MNDLINEHFEEIFQLFKNLFKNELNKSHQVEFEILISSLQKEIPAIKFNKENTRTFKNWFLQIYEQNFITKLFELDFEEIYFHSAKNIQIKSNKFKKINSTFEFSEEDFQLALEILARHNQVDWNYNSPFISFNIKNNFGNFRISLIHQSTGPKSQSKIFIRKNNSQTISLSSFEIDQNTITLLKESVLNKKNILISGSTGSGKTTLLKALINEVNDQEHIILIEDTHELNLENKNITFLQAEEENSKKNAKSFCSYAMRMSPDRMIIGELRSNEITPFLLSMNTGHKGLMSSIHANSAKDVIHRMHLLFSIYADIPNLNANYVRELIIKNIDLIIHLENKKIIEIIRPICMEEDVPIVENLFIAS